MKSQEPKLQQRAENLRKEASKTPDGEVVPCTHNGITDANCHKKDEEDPFVFDELYCPLCKGLLNLNKSFNNYYCRSNQ